MSCPDCERLQEFPNENRIYIRVGISNVEIIACSEHAKELIETYRRGTHADKY
jgi:hypothetical protein